MRAGTAVAPGAGDHQARPVTPTISFSLNRGQAHAWATRVAIAVTSVVVTSVGLAPAAHAITPAMPRQVTCPLTGETFQFTADYGSFTSFGRALDFEPLVMGMLRSSPERVPQCAGTGLPVYRIFMPAEIEKLRSMVEMPAWKERLTVNNPSYLVAYTQYVLGEGDLSVANSLLRAVWSATPQNRSFLLSRAIETWSQIADTRRPHDRDWVAANWLRVEFNRQRGEFEKADYWLRDFEQRLGSDHVPITDGMITLERHLITKRNSEPAAAPKASRPQ